MNVFESNLDDKEEQERNRMETRKYIERKYPEPKFKPKIVRRNCKDYIDAFKKIRGLQNSDKSI